MISGGRPDEQFAVPKGSSAAQQVIVPPTLPVDHQIKNYNAYLETAICQPSQPGGLEWTNDVYIVLKREETKDRQSAEAAIAAALRDIEGRDFGKCRQAQFLRLAPDAAKALEAMKERNRKKRATAADDHRDWSPRGFRQ